ncbi:protein kinase [bacterium]|nr:protein kinase [bacterium]
MGISIQDLVRNLTESGLLSQDEMATIHDSVATEAHIRTGDDLARELVRQNYLTKLQAAAVLKGKTSNLVFGDYIVLEKIGSGGMGQVFKAQHKPTGKNVALKVLSADAVKNKRLIERFKKEAKAVARLKHPNIVRAYEAGKFNRIRYLVMELVEGENMLARVKRKGPLPVDECVACVLQAARGLGYAHEKGVTHRDIKPSNLLRDRHTGRVKILDMGLARVEEAEEDEDAIRLTMPGQMLGTARFMAPEQIEDARKADVRSDVYSLGCTLYYLLRGKAPYSGETVAHTLMAHVSAPVPDLCKKRPDVPDWLGNVFQKMLAKDPDERFQKMSELVDEIQLHLGEQMARESSDHVLDDEDLVDEDDYSKLIAGRTEEGSSLESLYSEDVSSPAAGSGFAENADQDVIEDLVADSPDLPCDETTNPQRRFGTRPAGTERTSESPKLVDVAAAQVPFDAASPQSFRLPDPADGNADGQDDLPTAPTPVTEPAGRGDDYVRDKLKQRQDHQRAANRRVQLIASAIVGAVVMGLLIWIVSR